MSKSVLISIKPQWCELIANGQKTVEVRKARPKIETPFKCYIYCTKAPKGWVRLDKNVQLDTKVIGEFLCDRIYQYSTGNIEGTDISDEDMIRLSCLSGKELCAYEMSAESKENCVYLIGLYGWHISNLIIYDEPKELSDFYTKCDNGCEGCNYWKYTRVNSEEFDMECSSGICGCKPLNRPPQSWCYVVEVKE